MSVIFDDLSHPQENNLSKFNVFEQNFNTKGANAVNKILKSFWRVIPAKLSTSKLLFNFYYLFHHNCGFVSFHKGSALCSVGLKKRKKHQVLAVLRSCNTAKHVSEDK